MYNENINNKAVKRLYELYGENPDLRIVNRFLTEKKMLWHFGVAEYFDELSRIISESMEKYNEKLIRSLKKKILGVSEEEKEILTAVIEKLNRI